MTHQEQGARDDQNQRDDDPDHIDDQQAETHDDEHQSDQDEEEPAVLHPGDSVLEGVAQRGRVHPIPHDSQGQAVGQSDELVGEEQ
ncbi:hypothetical protein ACXIZN_24580 [Amycolatopsis sp. TRM77291]